MSPNPSIATLEQALKDDCKAQTGDDLLEVGGKKIPTVGPNCNLPLPNPDNCPETPLSTLRVQDGRIGLHFEEGVAGRITVAIIAQDVNARAQLELFEACGNPPAIDLVADNVHTRAVAGDAAYQVRMQVIEGKIVYMVDRGGFAQTDVDSSIEGTLRQGAMTQSIDGQIELVGMPAAVKLDDRSYRANSGCDINMGSALMDPTALIALIGTLLLRKITS